MQTSLLIVLSASTTAVLILVLRPLAYKFHLVDYPGQRRAHSKPTPPVGGLAMTLGALFTLHVMPVNLADQVGLLFAVLILAVLGTVDDRFGMSAGIKLGGQCAAALIAVLYSGIQIDSLGDLLGFGEIKLGSFALPFTVFSCVTAINAVNMIDGVDGLAGLLGLLTVALLAVTAASVNASAIMALNLVVAGALLGFLAFNARIHRHRHALVFMGDAGSMILGLMLAWLIISMGQAPWDAYSPVVALWLLAVPLADGLSLAFSRLKQRRSPLSSDDEHLHHVLIRLGLPIHLITMCTAIFQAILSFIAIYSESFGIPEYVLFWLFLAWLVLFHLLKRWLCSVGPSGPIATLNRS